jgi:hypothetical protein
MKITSLLLAAFLCANAVGQSVKDAKIVVYKYSYIVDENIAKAAEDKSGSKSIGFGVSTDTYEDYAGKKTEYKSSGNRLTASLIDTLYSIVNVKLKEKFNAQFLPINTLDGKVKYIYHDPYPTLPDATLKLAMKSIPDSVCYAKMTVSIQRQGVGVGIGSVGVGSTKAIVLVWMEIYGKDGKKLQDVKGEAKGDEPIISAINLKTDIKIKDSRLFFIRKHVSELYSKAIDDLIGKIVL